MNFLLAIEFNKGKRIDDLEKSLGDLIKNYEEEEIVIS